MSMPDKKGHFGIYGGKFAPETLMPALAELEAAYLAAKKDREFQSELDYYFREFIGRPTSLYFAKRLTDHLGGAKIYLKREDLCHTGAHKINNSLAQVLLAKRMGKTRVIAETGAEPGYALLQLGAQPAVAVREGREVEPGTRVVEVKADRVVLDRGGVRETLALPTRGKGAQTEAKHAG